MSDDKDSQHKNELNKPASKASALEEGSTHDEIATEFEASHHYASWIEAMLMVAKHYRLEYSAENVRLTASWRQDKPIGEVLRSIARQLGMTLKTSKLNARELTPWRLPLVVQFSDGQIAVVETVDSEGNVGIVYSSDQGMKSSLSREELVQHVTVAIILRPAKSIPDARVDDYIKPYEKNWLRKIILRDLKPYGHVMLASLIANTLALAGIIFSRQVYDRVIPAESMPTLYVLFSGVLLALLFDFILRRSRVRITDLLGKRADMRASDRVFGHALRIRNTARPKSTGTFISQIRELEYVRELLTSTTVTAFADMPFFILFCFVFWYIAGSLVLVPIGAVVLMIIPGLLVQRKLRSLANDSMRESSLRSAMLVETVQGMEDIKTLQAEPRFQNQWNHYNAVTADMNLRLRYVTNSLSVWSQTVQTGVFATVVFFGAPMVMAGDLTTGSLVAASILASRMMAPMTQITQVLSKWQQAKVATNSLNQIMERPVDNPEDTKRVHRASILGSYQFTQAAFKYASEDRTPSLQVKKLNIAAGERIAILGRNGAGKSTLLQACSGLLEPQAGEVLLDGLSLAHIDPADVRRDVSLLSQNSRLFHGTIRDNLALGAPNATDQELLDALDLSGANEFIRKLPDGLEHVILEGGTGLSGGQRQSLLLSRLIVRQPTVVLLDEPTASLDETTEKRFLQQLNTWLPGKTFIVATHRMSVLNLVERIVVVDNGQVVMDGTKSDILAKLSKKPAQAARTN
ncbi:type I secretion system permease/ATPase [Vreelandella zhanjiangensis]|uniref:type I secretion system permease/ATPase n=1 Tax=Vreelandella zhanjiangensis TaxID=1121960 RepID=UPI00035E0281|nr:type I secretion system permease/ATPase [Halomonas zhanjiangensis]